MSELQSYDPGGVIIGIIMSIAYKVISPLSWAFENVFMLHSFMKKYTGTDIFAIIFSYLKLYLCKYFTFCNKESLQTSWEMFFLPVNKCNIQEMIHSDTYISVSQLFSNSHILWLVRNDCLLIFYNCVVMSSLSLPFLNSGKQNWNL